MWTSQVHLYRLLRENVLVSVRNGRVNQLMVMWRVKVVTPVMDNSSASRSSLPLMAFLWFCATANFRAPDVSFSPYPSPSVVGLCGYHLCACRFSHVLRNKNCTDFLLFFMSVLFEVPEPGTENYSRRSEVYGWNWQHYWSLRNDELPTFIC